MLGLAEAHVKHRLFNRVTVILLTAWVGLFALLVGTTEPEHAGTEQQAIEQIVDKF